MNDRLTKFFAFLETYQRYIVTIAALCTILGFVIGIISAALVQPNIDRFDIEPNTIFANSIEGAKLSWSVSNAYGIAIQGIGSNLKASDSIDVNPKENIAYILTATKWPWFLTTSRNVHVWNPVVNITEPKNEAWVKAHNLIAGTFSGDLPKDQHIWIVVHCNGNGIPADKWWPQSGAPLPLTPSWRMIGDFGGNQDANLTFTIKAILVDDNINYILNKVGEKEIYLPEKIKTLDSVIVTRVADEPSFALKITKPNNDEKCDLSTDISGTFSGKLPNDKYVWIVVGPHTSPGDWYPQGNDHLSLIDQEPWNAVARIGGDGDADKGNSFDIRALLVDQDTNKQYLDWISLGKEMLAKGEPTLSAYPPLKLPDNAETLDQVTVKRS
jgi:hypothetical protein